MKYSIFTSEQIQELPKFDKICEHFYNLATDDSTREILRCIFYDGGYKGLGFSSQIGNKDNPVLELNRRICMAYLLIRNPETFHLMVENKINIFHGTNVNALFNILKYGLNSQVESEKKGVDVVTGEEWSRMFGKRNFVSLTDILDIAEGYASISPKGVNSISFPVVICTSTEAVKENGYCIVHSDVPEIGVRDHLPLDKIKMIMVPSERIEFVKKLLGDSPIIVASMDGLDEKFYHIGSGGYDYLHLDEKSYEDYRKSIFKKVFGRTYSLEEFKYLFLKKFLASAKEKLEDIKKNMTKKEEWLKDASKVR